MTSTLLLTTVLAVAAQTHLTEDQVRDQAQRWFTGPIAHVPDAARQRLIRLATAVPGGVRALTSETFRGNLYLEVLLNSAPDEDHRTDGVVFDRMAAVTNVVKDRLLPVLFTYAEGVGEDSRIYGIKLLLIELPANAFIQLYSPLSEVRAAKAGKRTPQQLLDASVLFVNHDSVRLILK